MTFDQRQLIRKARDAAARHMIGRSEKGRVKLASNSAKPTPEQWPQIIMRKQRVYQPAP